MSRKRGAAKPAALPAAAAAAAAAAAPPALAFVAHAGLSEETESGLLDSAPHDATDRSVFVVVKFAYFTFRLGSAAGSAAPIDFRRPESAVEAVLVYDDASGRGSQGGGGGGEARSKRKPAAAKGKSGRGRGGKRVRRTRGGDDDDDDDEDDDDSQEEDDEDGGGGDDEGKAAARQQPEEGALESGRFRAVDFVTQAPIEYSGEPSGDGQTLTLTMRLRVLSSQHEDSLFRIRFGFRSDAAVAAATAAPAPLITRPVRVVSKPEQLAGSKKKRLMGGQEGDDGDGEDGGDGGDGGDASSGPMEALMRKHRQMVDASAAGEDNALLRKKKRSFAHAMVDALQRIEKMQSMQRTMMGDLMAAASGSGISLALDGTPATATATTAASTTTTAVATAPSVPPPPPADFGSYFERMVASFGRIPTEQRAGALRSAIAAALMQGDDSIAELLDMMLGGGGGGGGGSGGGGLGDASAATPSTGHEDLWTSPR